VQYSSFPARRGSINEKTPFQGIIKKILCKNIEMNVWQSNLIVSLVGTDLGFVLGKSNHCKSNDWHYNLQSGWEHHAYFLDQPLLTNSKYLWVALSYGKENPHSSFQPPCTSFSISPVPSSAPSLPRISSISNESKSCNIKKGQPCYIPSSGP